MIYIIPALALLVALWFILRSVRYQRSLRELNDKISLAMQAEGLVKITYDGHPALAGVSQAFNALGQRYFDTQKDLDRFSQLRQQASTLDAKVADYESSISQINLLTGIGKDITGSLSLEEIIRKLYHYISSSMITDELHLLLVQGGATPHYTASGQTIQARKEAPQPLLQWVVNNHREAFLNNAAEDYGQYLGQPVLLAGGSPAGSVIALPLGTTDRPAGSVLLMTARRDAYSDYHLEFARSAASYVSVALENAQLYAALDDEKKRSDDLLLNILPEEVANELKQHGRAKARQYEHVSVLFTDFVNFTTMAERLTPDELVHELNECFTGFDLIAARYKLEKIKTIGDAYLAVCGLPVEHPDHAFHTIEAALDIRDFMLARHARLGDRTFRMRLGVHSGSVVAGIVGVRKFAFDIWGDAVNTAARMEQHGEADKVNVSADTHALVRDSFQCTPRGAIAVKNKNKLEMYFVERRPA